MRAFSFTVPPYVLRVLCVLEAAGYPAYIVGGSLRDAMRGQPPHDWDVTTPASPDRMLEIFSSAGLRTIETGIKHGTVTVLVEGEPIECTTYRIDGTYTDGRHPDCVSFTDRISDDLCRRDFTVNAMACRVLDVAAPQETALRLDARRIELVDLFGGREDLERGILRCVGEPERRFSEDALRILRCVRFCVQLGFRADGATVEALATCREGLANVSPERRAAEMLRVFSSERELAYGFSLLDAADLWEYVLPGAIATQQNKARAACLPPDAAMRIAQLYYNNERNNTEAAASGCHALRLSRAMTEDVTALVDGLEEPLPADDTALRRLMARYGERAERVLILCAHRDTDDKAGIEIPSAWRAVLDRAADIRAAGDCLSIASLAIGGRELAQRGLRGSQIGRALNRLLERVLDDPTQNTKERLLALLDGMPTEGEEG